MTTETSKPKTRRRKKQKLSYGPRGLETLRLCFQLGGVTTHQHARFFSIAHGSSYGILSSLAHQKLVETAPIMTRGRPRDFYFLSKSNASRAVAIGGHETGLRERQAKEQYSLHQLPQAVEHAHARIQFYLELLEASREESPVADVPLWEMWGESFRGFPLCGTKKKIFPDGQFEVRFDSELSCRYYLEYESRSRPGEVLRKLDSYGAHFSRRMKDDEDAIGDWLRPVIFLFPQSSTAIHVARTISEATRAKAPELKQYLSWRRLAKNKDINAGRLVLFANMETLQGRGALGVEYAALEGYLPEDEGVGAGGRCS